MASNLTSLVPSGTDLLMAFPRMGSHFAGMFGLNWNPLAAFANDTNVSAIITPGASITSAFAQSTVSDPALAATSNYLGFGFVDQVSGLIERLASFDGVFSYVASRWALSTLALVSYSSKSSSVSTC